MRAPQTVILAAVFILFIGMHVFGHGHGGGCCGHMGNHGHEDKHAEHKEESDNGKKD